MRSGGSMTSGAAAVGAPARVTREQGPTAAELAQAQAQIAREAAQAQAEAAREAAQAAREAAREAAQGTGVPLPPLPPLPNVPEVVRAGPGPQVTVTRDGRTIVVGTPREGEPFVTGGQAMPMTPTVPREFAAIAIVFFIALAATIIFAPLARALARRVDRQPAGGGGGSPDITARLERIEQAVDAIAVEVERISEGQRFTAKLLGERTPDAFAQLTGRAGDRAADGAQPNRG